MNIAYTIRDLRLDSDLPRLAGLFNLVDPEPNTPEEIGRLFERQGEGFFACRRVAEVAGEVVAYSGIVHERHYQPGEYQVYVLVDTQWRNQGIGAALAAGIQAALEGSQVRTLRCMVRQADADGLAFAQRYGFAIDRHLYESTLDLESFDETPFAGAIPALEAQGFHFFSLAEQTAADLQAGRDPLAAAHKLHAVNYASVQDIPGHEGGWLSFEDFQTKVMGADWFNPHGQFFVSDGDPAQGAPWVGLCAMRLAPNTGGAYNLITGVLREYRGRKLALALKLVGIRYARQNGARYVRTNNDSFNAPMLAINRKLGYQPQPGVYFMKRLFSQGSSGAA